MSGRPLRANPPPPLWRRAISDLYLFTLGRYGIIRWGAAVLLFLIIVGNYAFDTPRDAAFRNIDSETDLCKNWSLDNTTKPEKPQGLNTVLAQRQVLNDERLAILWGARDRRAVANELARPGGVDFEPTAHRTRSKLIPVSGKSDFAVRYSIMWCR